MEVNIIKTDNSLDFQNSLLKRADAVVDLTSYKGLRYLSQRQALKEVCSVFDNLKPGICFLGSSDFHHLSLELIGKLPTKPILIIIDHHSDMYETFPGMVSCGSWVMNALKELYVKKCIAVGIDNKDPALSRLSSSQNVIFLPVSERKNNYLERILDELAGSDLPIYISIDKDVLSTNDAAVSWQQGSMALKELIKLLLCIKQTGRVIGVDVSGEWVMTPDKVMFSLEDKKKINLNQKANVKILEAILS